ncbi:MAG: hypothetical protein LIP02_10085 [Bacteroidales bacterium]|nr:hypothetical protein [Bacteroidales bacterium]
MATYFTYRCAQCGYEHEGNPAGFDGIMAGLVVDFYCEHCKEIVDALMHDHMYWVDCPKCGKRVTRTWNPIDGHCPKCGGKMEEVPGAVILAD